MGGREGEIVIMRPPMQPMDRAKALRLAAWLVALADHDDEFPAVLKAVLNT